MKDEAIAHYEAALKEAFPTGATGKYITQAVFHHWNEARKALAQPEQEPVACPKCKGLGYYDEGHECDDGSMAGGNYIECDKCKPKREPLTDEEIIDKTRWVCVDMRWPSTVLDIARAIEAAHGIKENK